MNRLFAILFPIVFLLFYTGCSSSEKPEEEEVMPHLSVVCPISGLGDMGYNDMAMEGILRFCKKHDVVLNIYRPVNKDEVKEILKKWQATSYPVAYPDMLVLMDDSYRNELDALGVSFSNGRQILLFESDTRGLPDGVTTFNINRYGVCYLAGSMAREHSEAQVIAAMPGNVLLENAIDGFRDGYEAGGKQMAETVYLADNESGFNAPGKAFRIASEIENAFILPLAGASSGGIYKYSREYPFYLSLIAGYGRDCSLLSSRIPFSIIIYIDRIVEEYLEAWFTGIPLEQGQVFGLASGYTDILLNPVFDENLQVWEDYYEEPGYWNRVYAKYRDEAIEKETEHE